MRYDIESHLPGEVSRQLLQSWIQALSESLGLSAWSGGGLDLPRPMTFGDPNGPHFIVTDHGDYLMLDSVTGLGQSDVERVIADAIARVAAADFGQTFVYTTTASVPEVAIMGSGRIHFMRVLGSQPHIEGPRRVADLAILDFEEGVLDRQETPILLFPLATTVQISVFAQGPCSSELTHRQGAVLCELAAAVCAFGIGRPVELEVPMFPLEGPEAVALLARQRDPEILQLARNHVSLDIFGTLIELGGQDAFERVRGSMLAYHAALKQESGDVAVMLLVTAIEALLAPRQFWGKEKVTSRFVQGLIDLCPEVVDETVRHGNVEQAFEVQLRGSPTKRRKQLLSRVYDSRSLPTHTGLAPSAIPFGGVDSSGMRVALLDDLARGALLAYLESPRSSTVGHPMYRTE